MAFKSRPGHIEPVTIETQNSSAPDLEAPVLQDIAWVWLCSLPCSRLSSSKLVLWLELASKLRVRDRRYMRSSIWRRSEVGIIVPFDTPIAELLRTCIVSANWGCQRMERDARWDIDRVDQIFCRIGCPATPSAPIGWLPLVQMDAMDV